MTPVRRSKRIADKTPKTGEKIHDLKTPKGLEIDVSELGKTFNEKVEFLANEALESADNQAVNEMINIPQVGVHTHFDETLD